MLIEAARSVSRAAYHLLFSGPGFWADDACQRRGKQMGCRYARPPAPAIDRAGDLAAILTNLREGRHPSSSTRYTVSTVRSKRSSIPPWKTTPSTSSSRGPAARSIRLDIPHFTLIAATTRSGMLTGPLRDRFGAAFHMDYYSDDELKDIVIRSATILSIDIADGGAFEIASRLRATPRLANRILKRVRDFLSGAVRRLHRRGASLTMHPAFFEVDELRLDPMDNRILDMLVNTFEGRLSAFLPRERPWARSRFHRGRLRAVPAQARARQSHAQGASSHPQGLRAFGKAVSREVGIAPRTPFPSRNRPEPAPDLLRKRAGSRVVRSHACAIAFRHFA